MTNISYNETDLETNLRVIAMKQLIRNLQSMNRFHLDPKTGALLRKSIKKRRLSDPPPYSTDHKNSVRAKKYNKGMLLKARIGNQRSIDLFDDGNNYEERKVTSLPVSPRRGEDLDGSRIETPMHNTQNIHFKKKKHKSGDYHDDDVGGYLGINEDILKRSLEPAPFSSMRHTP